MCNGSFTSTLLKGEVEKKDAEEDEQNEGEGADEKAVEEGTPTVKLVNAVNARMSNCSSASTLLEGEVGKKDVEDEGKVEAEDAEKADEEGTPAVKLVKAVKACIGNGSFTSAMLEDEVEKRDEEDDKQIEVEDAWFCLESGMSDIAAQCQFCCDCLACGRCFC